MTNEELMNRVYEVSEELNRKGDLEKALTVIWYALQTESAIRANASIAEKSRADTENYAAELLRAAADRTRDVDDLIAHRARILEIQRNGWRDQNAALVAGLRQIAEALAGKKP